MMKLSKNKKTNAVLNEILLDLVNFDNFGEYEEVRRYYESFKDFSDYNLYSYGTCCSRLYNDEIKDLFSLANNPPFDDHVNHQAKITDLDITL